MKKITGARKAAKRSFDRSVFNPSPRDWTNWKKAFHFGVRFAESAYKNFNGMQWAVMEDGNTKAIFDYYRVQYNPAHYKN